MNVRGSPLNALDGYTAIKPLAGSQARARVHLATREKDGREVALRVLDARKFLDPFREARRQADVLRACAGPGVPEVLDLGVDGTSAILVVEPTRGIPLADWVRFELPGLSQGLEVAAQLAEILTRVHAARLVHRSITPYGVCVEPATLRVSLLDFEQMQPLGSLSSSDAEGLRSDAALAYAAPEQTGRMNRGVEPRSDLYSLGATLYFVLTGRPPFESSDPLALIHAHMARAVRSPAELRPGLGQGVARMVLRLLNKQPEDRYASAHSLLDDLRRCQNELASRGAIADDFEIGANEVPDRPRFSRQLYGREREVEILKRALEGTRAGRFRALLIRGEPGSGKSALVDGVRTVISQQSGYLAAGKFEQYRERPYSGWIAALESFTHQLLGESDERLARWKREIEHGVGSIARALVAWVPDLELILTESPPVPPLGPRETQARLSLAFARFVRTCATPEHPLVLFLDDLQWADAGSRFILHELLSEEVAPAAALLIGACRRQIDAALASSIERSFANVPRAASEPALLDLEPLSQTACAQLLADALGHDTDAVLPLARLVDRKTGSVPFLVQEFVGHIQDRGMLRYHPQVGWSWDAAQIGAASIPDGAVDLLIARFERLAPDVRRLLELASCVGDSFDLTLLSELSERAAPHLEPSLYTLADAGLIAPCDSGFRFAHDRIREAAQALLSSDRLAALHYDLGRLLLERLDPAARAARALEIADHLARGSSSFRPRCVRRRSRSS